VACSCNHGNVPSCFLMGMEFLDQLNGCQFLKKDPAVWSHLRLLLYSFHQELNLSGLKIDWVADSTFSQLKKLQVLDLRNNKLKLLQQTVLSSPSALQVVYLSGELRIF